MKIAVSTDNGNVSVHFGRCASYTIYDIDESNILAKEEIPNPGHEPGFLPQFLSEKGVRCIIAGGMGPRAQALFAQKNIETVIGVQGAVDNVIQKYLAQNLEAGTDLCDHGGEEAGHRVHESRNDAPVQLNSQASGPRICVTSLGPDVEAEVDPKFGRANYFLIIDPKTSAVEAIENPNRDAAQGSGIQSAQLVSSKNVGIVFTGSCGPKAESVLQSAGIQIKTGVSGQVKDVLANFKMQEK
jgi:predicted Fe-Mo cluster-binding NifX family protein